MMAKTCPKHGRSGWPLRARPTTRRFHISVGPTSLFERCLHVVKTRLEPIEFGMGVKHFVEREAERQPPGELLGPFRSADWELVTVETLESNGKWFSAGWRRRIGTESWFLVFGRSGDKSVIVTVFPTSDRRIEAFKAEAEGIVRPGDPFFDKVARVNQALMDQER